MGLCNTASRLRRIAVSVTAATAVLASAGCGSLGFVGRSQAKDIAQVNVSSPELRDGKPLPREYSCHGNQGSPPLRWSSRPLPQAKSIAIVVDSHATSESAVHWVLYDIPATTTELGPDAAAEPPEGSRQAKVTSGRTGYDAPCEDQASYRFSVYTLSGKVDLGPDAELSEILKEIAHLTIARGRLTAVNIE